MFLLTVLCLAILSALNISISVLMQQIIDTIAEQDINRLLTVSLWSAGIFLFLIVIYLVQRQTCAVFIRRAMTQYKEYVLEHLLRKGLRSVTMENTSKYISMLTNDTASIENNYLSPLFNFFLDSISLILAVVVMFFYSSALTVLAVFLSLLPVCASVFFSGGLSHAENIVSEKNEGFVNSVKEIMTGFYIVKTFRAEKEMQRIFRNHNTEVEEAKFRRRKTAELVNLMSMGAGILAQLIIFIVAAYLSMTGQGITPGTVIIFLNLMNFIVTPIISIPSMMANRKAVFGLIHKMAELLYEEENWEGRKIPEQLSRKIEFCNVSFGYEEAAYILKNVSAVFERGKSYAIVGSSGSGKSTLLNLLLGNYREYEGQILIDGVELKSIDQNILYDIFSIIHQNVYIYNDSIQNNITMYKDYPADKIQNAANRAGLTELIEKRGLDYSCGENGNNLSGGEKQRISIARCLLHETSVLLVDEATAALDRITSDELLNTILNMKDMTEIVITHYLEESILRKFDFIITVSEGHISEIGSYQELIEKKGVFYSLFTSQK